MTLSARLVVLVLVALLPTIGVQIQGVRTLRAERDAEVLAQAEHARRVGDGERARIIDSARLMITAVAEAVSPRAGDTQDCQTYLDRLIRRSADYRKVTVADADGRIRCGGSPALPGAFLADQPQARRAMAENRFVVGEWMPGRAGSEGEELPVAAPIHDADGRPAGVVTLALDAPLPDTGQRRLDAETGTSVGADHSTILTLLGFLATAATAWIGGALFLRRPLDALAAHKQAEAELRRAREEADRANAAKSAFLAAASHDLRQPVQSLYLFAAALADRLHGHPALPMLNTMRQGLDTLKGLLDGLLDMSRLESGKIVAAPTDLRLNQLLGRLVAEYAPRAAQKGLALRAVPTRAWVHTDPAHLERILRNLMENALRYTPTGRVLLGCRHTATTVRVELWDSGVGIPADRLEDIFEEFTQLGGAHERGLGLGLAIVTRLSRLLGHPVAVRSTEGKGSVFTVDLPRVLRAAPRAGSRPGGAAAPRPVATATANDTAATKEVVLVIDDEAIILLGLKAMLEGWGYDVLTARSGDQALERLRADGRCPRIVLADYQLQQGRTGPEALAAVQGLVGRKVPGIILTGDTAPERLREAERTGFRILHKPVFPNELRRMMATAGAA